MAKVIFLIEDGRPFWKMVAENLKGVNAEVYLRDIESVSDGTSDKKPDLIVAGAGMYKNLQAAFKNVPKLVILEHGEADKEIRAKDVYFMRLPFAKDAFLNTTAHLLYVSDRKIFKTLITVVHNNQTCIGRSENFSATGMAFKADKGLGKGDTVNLYFHVPGAEKRIGIEAEVVRCAVDPTTGSPYYGVTFVNLTEDVKSFIVNFLGR